MFLTLTRRELATELILDWQHCAESHRNSRCDLVRLHRRWPVGDAPVRAYTGGNGGGRDAVAERDDARS
jgi:hypothetical protein